MAKGNKQVLTDEKIKDELKKKEKKAEKIFNNPDDFQTFYKDTEKKFKNHSKVFENIIDDVKMLFSLIADIFQQKYKLFPVTSVIGVIASLVYFLSPIDVIPDILPFIGLTDDVAVIGFLIVQIKSDLDKYKKWHKKHKSMNKENAETVNSSE